MILFLGKNNVIFSASLDGTVRAYDTSRYRNFRTFTSPRPAQFSSLAVDVSGDLVTAGATDVYEVFLWSVATGHLLEVNMQECVVGYKITATPMVDVLLTPRIQFFP